MRQQKCVGRFSVAQQFFCCLFIPQASQWGPGPLWSLGLGLGEGKGVRVPLRREELQSVQRELEVLSEQYSQKCLENAHLAQALEAERQALRQCQRENQELNAHNQVSPQPREPRFKLGARPLQRVGGRSLQAGSCASRCRNCCLHWNSAQCTGGGLLARLPWLRFSS